MTQLKRLRNNIRTMVFSVLILAFPSVALADTEIDATITSEPQVYALLLDTITDAADRRLGVLDYDLRTAIALIRMEPTQSARAMTNHLEIARDLLLDSSLETEDVFRGVIARVAAATALLIKDLKRFLASGGELGGALHSLELSERLVEAAELDLAAYHLNNARLSLRRCPPLDSVYSAINLAAQAANVLGSSSMSVRTKQQRSLPLLREAIEGLLLS